MPPGWRNDWQGEFRDASIGTGIAVDKMLVLTGQAPAVAVQVILPTPEQEAERRALHYPLDMLTAKLHAIHATTDIEQTVATADTPARSEFDVEKPTAFWNSLPM